MKVAAAAFATDDLRESVCESKPINDLFLRSISCAVQWNTKHSKGSSQQQQAKGTEPVSEWVIWPHASSDIEKKTLRTSQQAYGKPKRSKSQISQKRSETEIKFV